MVYSTEAVRWRVRDVRAGFLGSARAAVAGLRLAGGASGSAAYEGRSREQAPFAAAYPPGSNPPRAPPTGPSCPCRSTGQEAMLGRWVRSAQPSATNTCQQMIVM
jgi:hypothetical protein